MQKLLWVTGIVFGCALWAHPAEAAVRTRALATATATYGIGGPSDEDVDNDTGWVPTASFSSATASQPGTNLAASMFGESWFSAGFGEMTAYNRGVVNKFGPGGTTNHTGRGGGNLVDAVVPWAGAWFEDEITVTTSGTITFDFSLHAIITESSVDDGGTNSAWLFFRYSDMDQLGSPTSDPPSGSQTLSIHTAGETTRNGSFTVTASAGTVFQIVGQLGAVAQTTIDENRPGGLYDTIVDATATGRVTITPSDGAAFTSGSGNAYAVPEPSSLALLALGTLATARTRRRR